MYINYYNKKYNFFDTVKNILTFNADRIKSNIDEIIPQYITVVDLPVESKLSQ